MKKLVITDTTPRGDLYISRGEYSKYLRRSGPDGYVIWSAARKFAGAWEVDEDKQLPIGEEMCIVNRRDEPLYTETLESAPGLDVPVATQQAPFIRDAVYSVFDEYKEKYNLVDLDALQAWLKPYARQLDCKHRDAVYSEPEVREVLGCKLKVARWDYTFPCGIKYGAFEVRCDTGEFWWPSGYMIDTETSCSAL